MRIMNAEKGLRLQSMTVREQAEQIKAGMRTSVSLCEECVRRIQENDQAGRKLNAVSALAPDWREVICKNVLSRQNPLQ